MQHKFVFLLLSWPQQFLFFFFLGEVVLLNVTPAHFAKLDDENALKTWQKYKTWRRPSSAAAGIVQHTFPHLIQF